MFAILKKRVKNQKGFTLVELMAVVVIIGILIAIAIPVYGNITENTKKKACEANVRAIKAAILMYHAANDKYPDKLSELESNYLEELPKCPVDENKDYKYNSNDGSLTHDHNGSNTGE